VRVSDLHNGVPVGFAARVIANRPEQPVAAGGHGPADPFIGDPRFGYWKDYVPAPYTAATPPPPTPQHVPWDGPAGGPTGFYTLGKSWVDDKAAPFAKGELFRARVTHQN
jgi:hypothetical protein